MTTENFSILNKKLDPSSSLWKKKYTLLLKRTENVEKQNLRLINRLYKIKKITKRLDKEKKFLVKRLDGYNDQFRNTKFFLDAELLPEGTFEIPSKTRDDNSSETNHKNAEHIKLGVPPKKPMSAFFRYCQAQHLKIMQEKGNLSHDEIKKTLSVKWNAMSDSEKEVYLLSYGEDYEIYEKQTNEFLNNFKEFVQTNSISDMFSEKRCTVEENEEPEESLEINGDIEVEEEKENNELSIETEKDLMNNSLSSSLSEELVTNSSDDEIEENG